MKKLLPLFMMLCILNTYAQTICENGFAGSFPCNDYDLMSQVSLATMNASAANDSWGWTDPSTNKEYALIALGNGTAFIDVSDPIDPIYLGKLPSPTPATPWRDVKVYQNHAFIVSDIFPGNHDHGMQVFDLTRLRNVTNPPQTFSEDNRYRGFGKAHNIVINEDKGFAYAVGTATFGGGPHFVDIRDPKNPVQAGGFLSTGGDTYSHDAQVITYNGPDTDYTGKEILIGSNQIEVVIADITDKTNPRTISTINYSNIGYTHQGWFTEDQRYFLLGDETDETDVGFNTRTIIFDFEDLDNPKFHMDYTGPTPAIDHNGYVKGNKFYLANYRAGLRVIDISDIGNKNIVEIGSFDTFPSSDSANFSGAWNVYPFFNSGNILISDIQLGLLLVRKSNTLSINDFANNSDFAMYPNPTKSELTIDGLPTSLNNKIEIYDILGKKIKDITEINDSKSITLTLNYTPGMYLVKINNTTKKLIIKD